ncbi:uncharacterized protein LOC131673695 isoform X3 [Phymastichus coffea]|uniref:uncharacterized protein LOC131673695 isoform X3 n=1 Tax=Phymastichus coffea TaxID=108790 RepID=UPI00273A7F1A|nr:uncharacterized protein LOC131673695 isoform X3 [Phymastichus coffea]XP_058807877.1 uncharacterized protein LOC131673695 isoform X3 [Phymastichus coffea]XP_058807878.1 uncharacterized protein LOC131673695 isoform X3 [Phymastichus coffea]
MGLSEIPEQMASSYYPTLTREEKARMHPCRKAKCVMMSTDTSPTLTASLQSAGYVELPDEPRPGKITPTTPTTNTTNSSPSPRAATSRSNGGSSSHEEEEVIEEAEVPIVRTTLPSPEPRPLIEHNGYKEHDRLDGVAMANSNGLKKPAFQERRDVDEDSCLIKCVYFTQQCCECVIV